MRLIKFKFKDGSEREFKHEGRGGGSWTKTLKLEEGWATVEDEYGNRFIFPREAIESIETKE